jgi:hypothetical protein
VKRKSILVSVWAGTLLSVDVTIDARAQEPPVADDPAAPATASAAATSEWKFDVSGYFRAPLRLSWGPPTTPAPNGGNSGTQIRTPPLVPDWNYIDWRYTNSMVGPWTELDFHYGNARARATVQIASYNITDSGYRRLESNLGINQAFLTVNFPEFISENGRLILTAGGYTNRYGAAGRYDGGKYETYLFARTHTAGETLTFEYEVGAWTLALEHGFGGKLEPIPFYPTATNTSNKPWDPYPGPRAQESTFVHHAHVGATFKKTLILGVHGIDTFANDNERAGSYVGMPYIGRDGGTAKPHIRIWGGEIKLLGGVLGDGYLGYAHLDAVNAEYLGDGVEVLHSFGGWQLHDNFFGVKGAVEHATGKIDTVEFQHVFSFGQLFRYPEGFWGDGPDLVAALFGMYNRVSGAVNPAFNRGMLKAGVELTYAPLPWLGLGGRFDTVQPNLNDREENFAVVSPRVILRSAFVTHEQVIFQYSRYFYGAKAASSQFPYNSADGALLGADKNAATVAAVIWF